MTIGLDDGWYASLHREGTRMSGSEMEASARLVTVLLCGEQSAIRIFAAEVKRGRAPRIALDALRAIEYDENLHEQALLSFSAYLPKPDDAHKLMRRAQKFFAGLGRINSMARHFGQISQLDSAVCKIMWHIEKSALDKASPLRRIATQIKNDEARHVAVSRRYAASLGLDSRTSDDDSIVVTAGLVNMLGAVADSFETIGVDSDRLFAHIRKNRSP